MSLSLIARFPGYQNCTRPSHCIGILVASAKTIISSLLDLSVAALAMVSGIFIILTLLPCTAGASKLNQWPESKSGFAQRQTVRLNSEETCTGNPESLFLTDETVKFIVSTFEDLAASVTDVFDVAEPLAKAIGAHYPHAQWDIVLYETARVNQTVLSLPFGGAGYLLCVEPKYDNVGLLVFALAAGSDAQNQNQVDYNMPEQKTMDFPGVANLTYKGYNQTSLGEIIRGIRLLVAAFELDHPRPEDVIFDIDLAIEALMRFYGPLDFVETTFRAFADQPRLKVVSTATQYLLSYYDLETQLMFMQSDH